MSSVVVRASNVDALSDAELEQRVDLLLAIWRNDTMLSSAINHDHFAYANIVEIGERVVPLLLRYLRDGHLGVRWCGALWMIVGGIPEHYRPKNPTSQQSIDGWVRWGEDTGLLPTDKP